jgi:hypothetical protein
MHVLEADGSYGIVAALVVVPGAMWMCNLTVAQDHTYVVGMAHWIVHNDGGPCQNDNELGNLADKTRRTSGTNAGAAASGVTRKGQNPTTNIGSPVTQIGSQVVDSTGKYHNCCAEMQMYKQIIDGLEDGTMQLEEDANGIVKIIVSEYRGRGPCQVCAQNAQVFANQAAKYGINTLQLGYRATNGMIRWLDPYTPDTTAGSGPR